MRMPNMMVTTFAIILVVGLLGFYWRDDNSVGDGEIGLQVGVPIQHALQASKITPMPIVLRLVNNTDTVATLTADGPCKLFRYVITTDDGGFIQAVRRPEVCEETITAAPLPSAMWSKKFAKCRSIPPATNQARIKFRLSFGTMKAKPSFS
jgi:hypothetical protein